MVDLAIPGRTGSQAPSAPGGVFWMNQAIFWPAPFLKFLKKLWEILKSDLELAKILDLAIYSQKIFLSFGFFYKQLQLRYTAAIDFNPGSSSAAHFTT